MCNRIILDEYANYRYKDLQEMLNSPEHKRFMNMLRQEVADGKMIVYPPLPPENETSSESPN